MPLQRQEAAPWQQFVDVQDVVMKAYDAPDAVDLGSADVQVAQATTVDDGDGERQAVLMFEPGTEAVMELADGSTKPLGDDLQVRATEYTVGASGDEAMPGELPPSSGYTYAVELSVDEAVDAGATDRHVRQAGRVLRRQLPRVPGRDGRAGGLLRPRSRRVGARRRRRGDRDPGRAGRSRDHRCRRRRPRRQRRGARQARHRRRRAHQARQLYDARQEPLARPGEALHAVGLQLAVRARRRRRRPGQPRGRARRRAPTARAPARRSAS